jgi:3-dehydroquinate synthase
MSGKKKVITVNLGEGGERTYRIVIEAGLLGRLPRLLGDSHPAGRSVFIITDSNVERLYGRRLLRGFSEANIDATLLSVASGESSKSADTVQALHTHLLKLGIHRDSMILALGGGVVGDVAGFVAATILRGVPYVQVPTTLLAQVDSSVGGKVGINHPLGKNLIGAFHQPAAVFIDPDVLKTLPRAEYRNGLAEVVKIAAALDRKFFRYLQRNARAVAEGNARMLPAIIARSVALKAAIVERDERDRGLRKVLNLGHTVGHALEAATRYATRHGEAVALGMVAESAIAVQLGLLPQRDFENLVRLLRAFKLPVQFPTVKNRSLFLSALAGDKKAEQGGTKYVLLAGIGKVALGVDVPSVFIQQLLAERSFIGRFRH